MQQPASWKSFLRLSRCLLLPHYRAFKIKEIAKRNSWRSNDKSKIVQRDVVLKSSACRRDVSEAHSTLDVRRCFVESSHKKFNFLAQYQDHVTLGFPMIRFPPTFAFKYWRSIQSCRPILGIAKAFNRPAGHEVLCPCSMGLKWPWAKWGWSGCSVRARSNEYRITIPSITAFSGA